MDGHRRPTERAKLELLLVGAAKCQEPVSATTTILWAPLARAVVTLQNDYNIGFGRWSADC